MPRVLPYDSLAAEYYGTQHKTSRNFDYLTKQALGALGWQAPPGLVLEPGCGRGRCGEFLGAGATDVIQLDNSRAMLDLEPRESSLLRVLHDAEQLPFADGQFSCVAAFLCDPFLGLEFLSEANRVLSAGGVLLGTTPTHEWGVALRDELSIDRMTTRFIVSGEHAVGAPSSLFPEDQLHQMLAVAGFDKAGIQIHNHTLPPEAPTVSPDIETAAKALKRDIYDLPILCTFSVWK